MATWRNQDFKKWMKETNASGLSQEQLKIEAMKFSEIFSNVDKKTISKVCDIFEKEEKLVLKDASHALFEEMGGQEGKMKGRKDIPPTNYFPQDQSQLKMIKFSPEEAAAFISGSNVPDHVVTRFQTVSNNKFGHILDFRKRVHIHVSPQVSDKLLNFPQRVHFIFLEMHLHVSPQVSDNLC